ncbi:response regulator [Robertkochia marina]|uniref:Response regulator n=1 Tax=Robertkochia marina TaxID=1227945 RepID=A0A4S3M046_9FLAO|nr:response regulator transcription factor [Robertkochia marina]THD66273.1 response regulator [Robertkochia marina]TRZ40913.1 response regulator [Robertkochia marina]
MEYILENIEWIGGIIATLLVGTFPFLKKSIKPNFANRIINNINISPSAIDKPNHPQKQKSPEKGAIKILFIDDQYSDYKIISILKRSGWVNTKGVKDITNLDDYKVRDAHIIFVDINGVGTSMFKDQGLGLASALKDRHPDKKIVLYSAENKGDRFHKALREVDDCLAKNAEPYEFITLIESLI